MACFATVPRATAWCCCALAGLLTIKYAQADGRPPKDQAVVQLTMPPGARVILPNGEGNPEHLLRYTGLRPGELYEIPLVIDFGKQGRVERRLLFEAGQQVRLAAVSPASQLPRPVLQLGHVDAIDAVAFSMDGTRVASGSHDATVRLWDAATGDELLRLEGHTDEVTSVEFSRDGRLLLSGSSDETLRIWDATTGHLLRRLEGHTGDVNCAGFSPGGDRIVSGSWDYTVRLWDTRTGRHLRCLEGHTDAVKGVAWSPDGERIVSGGDDFTVRLWDARTGEQLRLFKGHAERVEGVAYSPDGRRIASAGYDNTIRLWDVDTGDERRRLEGHEQNVTCVAFSPDGRRLLSGSWDDTVRLWDAATGRQLRLIEGHTDDVGALAFSADGARFLSGGDDRSVRMWDVETGEPLRIFEGNNTDVGGVAVSPDGRRILSGSMDGAVQLWDLTDGVQLRLFTGHTSHVTSAQFSPDGRQAVTGSWDKSVRLWDVQSGRHLRQFDGHTDSVDCVAFSPAGDVVASGSDDATIRLWDVNTGRQIQRYEGHAGDVWGVAFSPDGKLLLSAGHDGTVRLWDVETAKEVRQFEGHTSPVTSVAFSPDGGHAVTASWDDTAVVWDASTGLPIRRYVTDDSWVQAAVLSPDGRLLLSGDGNRVRLWDARSGRVLRTLTGHLGTVTSLRFTPDGRLAVSGSEDGTVRLWDVATGDEVAQLISLENEDWLVVTPQGLFDGTPGARQKVRFRVGETSTTVPVDRFYQDFARPGLLKRLAAGERLLPESDFEELADSRPPTLRLVSPKTGGAVDTDQVRLVVEVKDQGGGVRGPFLRLNGQRMKVPETSTRDGKRLRYSFTVPLAEAENRIRVEAATANGTWESEPVTLSVVNRLKLPRAHLYVLAVGVNRYAGASMNLSFARTDAEAIADVFRRRAGALYDEVQVHTVLDDQATRAGLQSTLTETIGRQARPQDTLVMFLAGHGYTVGQRYYFLPHEFQQRTTRFEEDIRRDGIPSDEIGDWLRKVKCCRRVLVLDTCNSGAAVRQLASRNPFGFDAAVQRLGRAEGAFVIAAAPATEDAREVRELGHGLLTYTLLAGLNAAVEGPLSGRAIEAGDAEGMVSVDRWFGYASAQTPRLYRHYLGVPQDVKTYAEGTPFPLLPLVE